MTNPHLIKAIEALQHDIHTLTTPSKPTIIPPQQAQNLLQTQKLLNQAHDILQQAQKEAKTLRQQAIHEGRQQAHRDTTTLLQRAHTLERQRLAQAEPKLVRLALQIAQRVVGRSLELDPDLIVSICAQALEHAQGREHITLRVHPDDLHRLQNHQPTLFQAAQTQVHLEADDRVPPGGCHIDTEAGLLEADLQTQFEVLAEALLPTQEPLS